MMLFVPAATMVEPPPGFDSGRGAVIPATLNTVEPDPLIRWKTPDRAPRASSASISGHRALIMGSKSLTEFLAADSQLENISVVSSGLFLKESPRDSSTKA